ncbi:ribulokinase [Micromonospora zamorensis]|uniref:ribulokinase n=1 Tax=Micromonospora zamorensis TaxID=709883 RepID=UPI002ED62B1D|nr:ribulokinase [Micromonospora zamorensis]
MNRVDGAGDRYVVGVDYGTLSGRALVVRVGDGAELGTAVHEYGDAVISTALPGGRPLPPDWALQNPEDYRDVLRYAVPAAVSAAGVDPAAIVGIGIDFTACTVLPTTADGIPLCEDPELRDRPHAWVKLWKHHAAQTHADRINALAHERAEPWIGRYGGKISAEWQYAKGLQMLEEDPEVYHRAERFIEAADWIVWQLCGAETRNVCTAGYKGILQDGQYPSEDFLTALNPGFGDFVTKLDGPLLPLGARAGSLTARAAAWTGLPEGIAVAVGNVDAHVTAASAQAVEPGRLVAIMGTSTCHVVNGAQVAEVAGMCGVVDGGISPGAWGYEAGQSGVGDIFGWFVEHAAPAGVDSHERLTELAASQPVGAHGLIALDWWNGNRSLLVNHDLSGMIVGMTLATRPQDIYRALLESTAYGTRMIIEAFVEAGVAVNDLVIAGGLTNNALLMQIYADVTKRPLNIIASTQGPALGSAIHAAVAADEFPSVHEASQAMGRVHEAVYRPDPERARAYDALYAEYRTLHDHFGRGGNDVMLRLRAIRNAAAGTAAAAPEAALEVVA